MTRTPMGLWVYKTRYNIKTSSISPVPFGKPTRSVTTYNTSPHQNTGLTQTQAESGIGKGWRGLLNEAYQLIEIYNSYDDGRTLVFVNTVKEKFGSLRIYISAADYELLEELDKICDRSCSVCEDCGGDGDTVTLKNGWDKTLCQNCLRKTQ